jgi:hypothetical protein
LFRAINITPAIGPQGVSGFACIDMIAHTKPPTDTVGSHSIANRNKGRLRWRIAHRMAFRFALLALLTSLFSGHSTILDILANILFCRLNRSICCCPQRVFVSCANSKRRFALSLNVGAVRPSIGQSLANDAFRQFISAVSIINTKRNAVVISENQIPPDNGADPSWRNAGRCLSCRA